MESQDTSRSFLHRCRTSPDRMGVSVLVTLLIGVWCAQALEMSVGKVGVIEALNGSTVLMPCVYSSCIGIKNLYFSWSYNRTEPLCEGLIPMEGIDPHVVILNERVEFVGSSKTSNISIIFKNITFEDAGDYICFGKNPKEKGRNHSATLTLIVVDELREVDNTLTVIIMSVVGGVIGFIVLAMVIKSLVLHILGKVQEKNKECLVSSSGNDNTENGLSGSKADNKATPKA
ncbi:sodium channel, voltage-gated, type IV, beta a [Alosa pseudoharengus]|uniref:sodium channel, voltage-gated, type IV, beta a n=1 Tax=Alosa pseudoharengus TaxID=34774 RepID=UPI001C082BE1|nr:sodium channel, voltage-gated, type IV, beta a isoform X1 [Alosa sapidissima]XP_048120061.1 sodium channel, voltage-gated, type IV, beta a isoform X1 [Alosa alosa]